MRARRWRGGWRRTPPSGSCWKAWPQRFGLEARRERIEVYDNSHISGRNAYGAMIVAGPEGFTKNAYRKFSIDNPEVCTARRRLRHDARGADPPLLARAEGGPGARARGPGPIWCWSTAAPGSWACALEVFAELGVTDVALVGVAKGPDRDAGRERFFMPGREPFGLEPRDPVLYFLQRLRDEAHRFAIGAHRAKRSKQIAQSPLDEIPGIGAKRQEGPAAPLSARPRRSRGQGWKTFRRWTASAPRLPRRSMTTSIAAAKILHWKPRPGPSNPCCSICPTS